MGIVNLYLLETFLDKIAKAIDVFPLGSICESRDYSFPSYLCARSFPVLVLIIFAFTAPWNLSPRLGSVVWNTVHLSLLSHFLQLPFLRTDVLFS